MDQAHTIRGREGNDTRGVRADDMSGDDGNDVYWVDNLNDEAGGTREWGRQGTCHH